MLLSVAVPFRGSTKSSIETLVWQATRCRLTWLECPTLLGTSPRDVFLTVFLLVARERLCHSCPAMYVLTPDRGCLPPPKGPPPRGPHAVVGALWEWYLGSDRGLVAVFYAVSGVSSSQGHSATWAMTSAPTSQGVLAATMPRSSRK